MDASRVIVCSPTDVMLTELSPDEVWACEETMEINGQHYLEIVTTRVLTKEQRVVVFDEGNHAHEYVVATEDREHSGGSVPFGTYKCPWSLQHDARLWVVNVSVGPTTPVQASVALDAVLSGTNRWVGGTVTLATTGSAEMRGMSGWDALSTLIEVWGGEIDAEVTVGQTGVTSRRVMLYAQMGQQTATRRFDYLCDLSSIKRHVLQDDVACRIIPRGKSEKGDDDVERYVTIESVNDGVEWLQNDDSALLYRLAGPNNTYEYPTVYVDNSDIETPQELKDWALSVIDQYTIPKVSYEMEVTYLYHAEYNPYGVGLGDMIQGVDLAFGDTPLRLEARVIAMTVDRLDRSRSTITVSNALSERSLAASVAGLGDWVNEIAVVSGGTADYIAHILDNLNAEINATGGFVYITDGQGLITYDKSVTDPLVGAEADQATEMKGGTLRFANKKTATGEWDWTNVITADGYIALAATIARITSGFIGSASGGNYWNLDTGEIRLSTATGIGDSGTIQDIIDGVNATITNVDVEYAQGTSATTAPTNPSDWSTNPPTWEVGKYIWSRTATTTGTGLAAHTTYSTPVMISGKDGNNGVGIVTIREQYYLSTSDTTQTGGNWSYDQPTWTKNTYIWTRSEITWDTTPRTTTYTDPILAKALTQANSAVVALNESLNQTEIFNRLTNNGQWQGIYTDPTTGDYYINATYLKTGILDAALIKAGILTSANGGNFWNLETGEFRLATTTTVGDGSTTLAQYIANVAPSSPQVDVDAAIYNYLTSNSKVQGIFNASNGRLYINATYINTGTLNASLITSGKIQSQNGKVYFDLTNNELHCDKLVSTDSGTVGNFTAAISTTRFNNTQIYGLNIDNSNYSDGTITIRPGASSGDNFNTDPLIYCKDGIDIIGGDTVGSSGNGYAMFSPRTSTPDGVYLGVTGGDSSIWLRIPTSSSSPEYDMELQTGHSCRWSFSSSSGKIYWGGYAPTFSSLTVSGSKNRVVETEDYGKRLLNSYETPSPMFGDVGSAVIGSDGICIVSIDDIFQETARTDIAYQVFLQNGRDHRDNSDVMGDADLSPLDAYDDELNYVEAIESLYD